MIQFQVHGGVRTRAFALAAALAALPAAAGAADLPQIKVSADNPVAACATPGRLMAFTRARNEKLDAKFDTIAADYMRHGEALGIRWDIAYFQMLIETGNLKFGGDVRSSQNNFAGLGATGEGEHGESFKDVSTGVRAHLEHVLMYAGAKIENPAAERTRKVQEWGVLTAWQKTIKGPMTFTQLARQWAPPARKYATEIGAIAESFMDGPCKSADPHPELVAVARPGAAVEAAAPVEKVAAKADTPAAAAQSPDKISGKQLAKRAALEARSEGTAQRTSLGAASVAKAAQADAAKADDTKAAPVALLNPPKPEAELSDKGDTGPVTKIAAAGAAKAAKPATPAASKAGACKVFTASYGGAKAVIIKATTDAVVHYTVLDVNEGEEQREAEAYIAAYAPGGKQVGEFASEAKALDTAFDLCPEG